MSEATLPVQAAAAPGFSEDLIAVGLGLAVFLLASPRLAHPAHSRTKPEEADKRRAAKTGQLRYRQKMSPKKMRGRRPRVSLLGNLATTASCNARIRCRLTPSTGLRQKGGASAPRRAAPDRSLSHPPWPSPTARPPPPKQRALTAAPFAFGSWRWRASSFSWCWLAARRGSPNPASPSPNGSRSPACFPR